MYRQIPRLLSLSKLLRNEPTDLRARQAITDDDIRHAKRLHADVFLNRGYVTNDDIENQIIGLREDPYQAHAHYFITERRQGDDWQVVAAARLIHSDAQKAHGSFQTVLHQKLLDRHKSKVFSHEPSSILEVSGLVKTPGESTLAVMLLYRQMWQFSVTKNYHIWLMSCDASLYGRLNFMFGDTLSVIGEQVFFKGHEVVPAVLDIPGSLNRFVKQSKTLNPVKRAIKSALVEFFLRGLPVEVATRELGTIRPDNMGASR